MFFTFTKNLVLLFPTNSSSIVVIFVVALFLSTWIKGRTYLWSHNTTSHTTQDHTTQFHTTKHHTTQRHSQHNITYNTMSHNTTSPITKCHTLLKHHTTKGRRGDWTSRPSCRTMTRCLSKLLSTSFWTL